MKTLFSSELLTRLVQREKKIAEGKGIFVKRLEKLGSELRRGRIRVRAKGLQTSGGDSR